MNPEVVGVTLGYRHAPRTARCVSSLLQAGATRVLVWDNSDDAGVTAGELREQFAQESRAWLIESPSNLGFSAGVNRALERVAEEHPDAWVFVVNDDACVRVETLRVLHEALRAHPGALLAYPNIDHGGQVLGTMYYHRWLGLITRQAFPGSFGYPSGCALLIAPQRLQDHAVFDERFFMYGEDWELGWRLRAPGLLVHVDRTLVWHDGSASSGRGTMFYESRLVAAHWIAVAQLAMSPWQRSIFFGGRMLSLPLRAMLRAWRLRSWVPVQALLEGWRLAWGRDQQLQRARELGSRSRPRR